MKKIFFVLNIFLFLYPFFFGKKKNIELLGKNKLQLVPMITLLYPLIDKIFLNGSLNEKLKAGCEKMDDRISTLSKKSKNPTGFTQAILFSAIHMLSKVKTQNMLNFALKGAHGFLNKSFKKR